ncbi:MAG: family transcriptional regulator [Actinomycetia bacterium]|nr:family transcriptional regulator [Actinomycetes bacterium]
MVGSSDEQAPAPGEFGRLVLRYREARGLSQQRLATEAGLSDGYISLIETGRRGSRPSRDTVLALAQALGVPAVELLRAAGRLQSGDDLVPDNRRPSFEEFVRTDPALRADQKRILIELYSSWVRRSA